MKVASANFARPRSVHKPFKVAFSIAESGIPRQVLAADLDQLALGRSLLLKSNSEARGRAMSAQSDTTYKVPAIGPERPGCREEALHKKHGRCLRHRPCQ
jgi:hypothetical protein